MRMTPVAGGALVLAGLLASPSRALDLTEIKTRGTLRVIAAEGEQPEEFRSQAGVVKGFEGEMLEGFAKLQGLELQVVTVKGWDDRIPALLRGDGDVIVALTDTDARRKTIGFTSETLPARHVVVTSRPHAVIDTVDDLLKQPRVGVVKATSWAEAATAAGVPAAKITTYGDLDTLLAALKSGAIDATVMSVSDFTLAAKRHSDLQAGVFVGPPRHQAWGVRKDDPQLAGAMNEYIANLHRSGTWNRLIVGYFGAESLKVLGRAHQ